MWFLVGSGLAISKVLFWWFLNWLRDAKLKIESWKAYPTEKDYEWNPVPIVVGRYDSNDRRFKDERSFVVTTCLYVNTSPRVKMVLCITIIVFSIALAVTGLSFNSNVTLFVRSLNLSFFLSLLF
jgi:hypothetical protein